MPQNTKIRGAKMDGVINAESYKVNKIVIEATIVHLNTFFQTLKEHGSFPYHSARTLAAHRICLGRSRPSILT